MSPTLLVALCAACLVSSWAATGLVRRYALANALLDLPNHRSSHVLPTPRGGGLAIVLVVLVAIGVATLTGTVARPTGIALLGGSAIVAAVGWIDDRRSLSVRARIAAHAGAAAWALAWLGGLPALQLGTAVVPLGWAGSVLALLGIVWMTNLFNFMDGIDGIAGSEAVSLGVFGGAVLLARGSTGLATVAFFVAAAAAGFLIWNWPPARIFMGDVGSSTLGHLFAVLALAAERAGAVPLLAWAILAAVFLFDATTTLVRRAMRGERWYEAHRSHAYQRAAQAGGSHRQVTTAVLLLNTLLAGMAALGVHRPHLMPVALAAALATVAGAYLLAERARPMGRASASS